MARAQDVQAPELLAGALEPTHSIDGRLDEPAWATAQVIDVFMQADPREGEPASARTVVRVLAGPKALIIGIDCEQPAGVGVVSFSVRRDATLTQEDHVRLVLGPFMDGRSGYVFAVNPSGARYDGIINPGGESDSPEWDGIWDAVTSRRDGGWTAEIWIPFLTLSFKPELQRAAPYSGHARNRPVGVGCAAVSSDTDQSCRCSHWSAGHRPGSRVECTARGDGGWWHSRTVCVPG
jgi:hypothetical protein